MDYRNIIYIFVILFYVPALLASGALTHRHGWRASWETWLSLLTFALTRLIGASLHLSTIAQPDNLGLHVAAATFAIDGLSPLLLSSFGLLRRLLAQLNRDSSTTTTTRLNISHIRFLELIVTAAYICATVGYRSLTRTEVLDGIPSHGSVLTAAASLYVVAFAGLAAATASLLPRFSDIAAGERRVCAVLGASLPLLLVRTLYLALDVLGNLERFSAISGDVTIFLCMALVEEAGVCGGYLAVGFTLRVLSRGELDGVEEKRESLGRGESV